MSPDSDFPDFGDVAADSSLPDFHRSTRMPLDAVVRLHFEGTVAYQNGFAANVSATGMFVKHPDPPPLGTRLVFEFVLGEERKPVQGAGVVAWAREKYEGPGRPAGIGIQFTEVDPLSRQHIAEALFAFLETQLGDELAESKDVVDLVATTSTRTPVDLVRAMGREEEEERAAAQPPPAPSPAPPRAGPLLRDIDVAEAQPAPFRIFEEEAEVPAAAEGGLFTPEIPPDEIAPLRAAAQRKAKSPWPAIAIGAAVAVGGVALWWFLAGPGSIPEPAPAVETTPAPRPAPPPRPALSPEPGTGATLAEVVGAAGAKAPEPLPVETAPPAAAPAPEVEAEPAAQQPAPQPAAAPPAPAPVPAAGARISRVSAIEWEEASGLTVVVLTGDAPIVSGSYRWNEIRDANPRVLFRFTQMAAGYPKTLLQAGTPELKQVRVGYHEKPAGNELHVVLDLAAPNVEVASVEAAGNRLYVRLAGR